MLGRLLLQGALCLSLWSLNFRAEAASFSVPVADDSAKIVLNTTATAGAQVRMQSPNVALISKSNLNPQLCGAPNQICQGVFRTQVYPEQALAAAPGQYTNNADWAISIIGSMT